MDVRITKSCLNGTVYAISSKSVAHRALIASALADSSTRLVIKNKSEDINATISSLKALGASVIEGSGYFTVFPIRKKDEEIIVDAKQSASTLRFLLPIATTLYNKVSFDGEKSLRKRPISTLLYALKGVGFTSEQLPLTVNGSLLPGDYIITGEESSQYISGLLFALPTLNGDSTLTITGGIVSKSYIEMTLEMLSNFSIKIERIDNKFIIKGNQKFISPKELTIEGDYSNGAFFIAPNKYGANITVENLPEKTSQGDRKIFDALDKIFSGKDEIIDVKNIIDLAPILAVSSLMTKNTITLTNTARLKIKESDRAKAIVDNITKMGGEAINDENSITIFGKGEIEGGCMIDCFNDHRIVMAFSIIGCFASKPITLLEVQCVNKSYPEFFNDLRKVGGNVVAL